MCMENYINKVSCLYIEAIHYLSGPLVKSTVVECLTRDQGAAGLVCECILGWLSVVYHFRVTVTLTSDLVFRVIVSRAYLLYYLR